MQRTTTNRFVSFALAMLVLAMLAPMTMPQVAYAKKGGDIPRHSGWVQSRPASGVAGTWTIGGKSFVATAGTKLDQAEGQLVLGACAKVKFQVVSGKNQAVEIDSEPARDCR